MIQDSCWVLMKIIEMLTRSRVSIIHYVLNSLVAECLQKSYY